MTTTRSRAGRIRGPVLQIDRAPLFVVLWLVASLSMLGPAVFGFLSGEAAAAAQFAFFAAVFSGLALMAAIAVNTLPHGNSQRAQLLSLVGALLVLPAMLALPLMGSVPGLGFANAYFEMVSAITTTGMTIFSAPERVLESVHFWRVQTGWLGGLMIWVAAGAVLAPLRLGGFEMLLTQAQVGRDGTLGRSDVAGRPIRRVLRFAADLAPVYAGLTFVAWIGLLLAGEAPFVALCLAMSTLATSGIAPVAELGAGTSGRAGEAVIFAFLLFALSRSLFAGDMPRRGRNPLEDRELQAAAIILAAVPTVIFLHHWVALGDTEMTLGPTVALQTFWGAIFTTLSFLSTTGFISADWDTARDFSALTSPGLVLMGLALIGGGVATTAGGVKLLRVFILYRHGQREVERLIHPSLVSPTTTSAGRAGLDAAYVAWLFFMILALSIAGVMVSLSLTGVEFETAVLLTIASLSTTGPLTQIGAEAPIDILALPLAAKGVLAVAMALGRLETLAVVALFNPEFWRS